MSSETSRKHSSVPHPRKPAGPPEFGHPALSWLGQDLLELGFGLGSEAWARWTSVGFSCGLRLANAESGHANKLLRECAADRAVASLLDELVLHRLAQRPFTVTDELTKVRMVFIKLLIEPPKEARDELARL